MGFTQHSYVVNEGRLIQLMLAKEDNITTEQTFAVEISTGFSQIYLPATRLTARSDYAFLDSNEKSLTVFFPPTYQVINITLTIIDDDIAEGIEAFVLHLMSSNLEGAPSYYFPNKLFADVTVMIQDDDGKTVLIFYNTMHASAIADYKFQYLI